MKNGLFFKLYNKISYILFVLLKCIIRTDIMKHPVFIFIFSRRTKKEDVTDIEESEHIRAK